jgi:hypothetical protein
LDEDAMQQWLCKSITFNFGQRAEMCELPLQDLQGKSSLALQLSAECLVLVHL